MGSSGLESGVKISGLKPGIKGGRSLAQMRSGVSSGLSNGIMNHRNMQDPLLLVGSKSPMIYWNAEGCTVNASNNVLTVKNLITTSVETLTITSDPNRVNGDVYNGKSGIAFDNTDFISSTLFFSKAEASVIVVVRPDATGGQFIINSIWTTFADTVGDFTLVSNGGTITANFIGNPNTTDCTITSYPLKTTDYHIVTLKLRLTRDGRDSMEMFVNGNKQSNYTVSNFTAGVGFQASVPMLFGGTSSQTLGGNAIGSALVFKYFLENHEQLRLENYLRWYYGRNF